MSDRGKCIQDKIGAAIDIEDWGKRGSNGKLGTEGGRHEVTRWLVGTSTVALSIACMRGISTLRVSIRVP